MALRVAEARVRRGQRGRRDPRGPAGPAGPAGAAGPAGLTVASTRACTASGVTNFGPTLAFVYQVITYTDGQKQVNCAVLDANRGFAETLFLKTGAGGLAASACIVGYDVEGDGSGGGFTFRNDA